MRATKAIRAIIVVIGNIRGAPLAIRSRAAGGKRIDLYVIKRVI